MVDTIILTGGTNGLGLVAAKALSRPGLRLVLVARNEAKAAQTCQALSKAQPDGAYEYVMADFSTLNTVAEAGAQLARRYPRINALINNAGIHAFSQRITGDGFSEMVSTNYLAPWLLTAHLRHALILGAPSRVVIVGSEASRSAHGLEPEQDLRDLSPFSRLGSFSAYGKTKLMNIMFSAELGRRLNGTGVVANCLDPGFNVTGLGRELPGAARLERILRFLGIGGPERGAAIITRLATDPQFAAVTGRYFSRNGDLIQPSPPGADKRLQGLLWDETERLLAPFCRATVMGGTLPDGSATRGHKAQAARDQ